MLNSAGPSDASARTAILANGAETATDAADQFEQLRQQNDPGLAKLATSLDAVNRDLDSATNDVAQTSALESDAERVLALALAAPPKPVATTTTTTRPMRTKVATATAAAVGVAGAAGPVDMWAALRNCESGGAYDIVSGSGRYRGAYQFDQSTW